MIYLLLLTLTLLTACDDSGTEVHVPGNNNVVIVGGDENAPPDLPDLPDPDPDPEPPVAPAGRWYNIAHEVVMQGIHVTDDEADLINYVLDGGSLTPEQRQAVIEIEARYLD